MIFFTIELTFVTCTGRDDYLHHCADVYDVYRA